MIGAAAVCALVFVASASAETDLAGSGGSVEAVAFFPDGRKLASGSSDGGLMVWDTVTGKAASVLMVHQAAVTSVAVSPDGRRVVSGSADAELRYWDADSAGLLRNAAAHKKAVLAVAFNAAGSRQFSAGADGQIRAWDFEHGAEVGAWQAVTGPASAAAISPTGDMAVFAEGGEGDWFLQCIVAESGWTNNHHYQGFKAVPNHLALSSDRAMVLAADSSGGLSTVSCSTGASRGDKRFGAGLGAVEALAFSPDGRLAASGEASGRLTVWDVASGRELYSWQGAAGGAKAVAFSPDGKKIAAGGARGILKVRDVPSSAEIAKAAEAALDAKNDEEGPPPTPFAAQKRRLLFGAPAVFAALILLSRTLRAKPAPRDDPPPAPKRSGVLSGILRVLGVILILPIALPALLLVCLILITVWNQMTPAGLRTGERDVLYPLGSIRSALSIYYGDMEGQYPADLHALLHGKKYLQEMPMLWRPHHGDSPLPGRRPDVPHPDTRRVTYYAGFTPGDTGRWGYVNNPKDRNFGMFFIDCTHVDSKGSVWSSY